MNKHITTVAGVYKGAKFIKRTDKFYEIWKDGKQHYVVTCLEDVIWAINDDPYGTLNGGVYDEEVLQEM